MFTIKIILSGAEVLTDMTREKLKKVFDCPIISVYPNQENGLLAEECTTCREFHVNTASYHIELLKIDSDEPAEIGEPGRIVVTDLFNHAMPLIRYDTGDIGMWKKEAECGWKSPVLSCIQGRLADFVFDTSGRKVSPFTIATCLCTFDKIQQFQFVQKKEKQYILKLNGVKGIYADDTFVNVFKGVMGNDAQIIVEHVAEIPVLKSGKRKEVVCNIEEN
jgi:phenylacetate-CoA ligase